MNEKISAVYQIKNKKYQSQLCKYNGETLMLTTLAARFRKAKKFLIRGQNDGN